MALAKNVYVVAKQVVTLYNDLGILRSQRFVFSLMFKRTVVFPIGSVQPTGTESSRAMLLAQSILAANGLRVVKPQPIKKSNRGGHRDFIRRPASPVLVSPLATRIVAD